MTADEFDAWMRGRAGCGRHSGRPAAWRRWRHRDAGRQPHPWPWRLASAGRGRMVVATARRGRARQRRVASSPTSRIARRAPNAAGRDVPARRAGRRTSPATWRMAGGCGATAPELGGRVVSLGFDSRSVSAIDPRTVRIAISRNPVFRRIESNPIRRPPQNIFPPSPALRLPREFCVRVRLLAALVDRRLALAIAQTPAPPRPGRASGEPPIPPPAPAATAWRSDGPPPAGCCWRANVVPRSSRPASPRS